MPQVKIIQPLEEQVKRLRVAAYVRVSSDSEDQLNSFSVQMEHYTGLIKDNAEWNFAGIYADEGITGMAADKRESFQRLLKDCRAGKIDRILVKSISRFARNSADTISVTRELKQLGVSIYFEKEGIDTADMGSEMLLSMLGAVAQEESVSISRNLQWGIRKRMQKGEYVTASVPFGYSYIDRTLVPNEKEAAVVRDIFQYYIENNHTPIVSQEMFLLVQEEIARRKSKSPASQKKVRTNRGRYTSQYALSERLVCGECGCYYRRVTWNIRGKKKIVWRCINRLEFGKKYCKLSPSISEDVLHNAILRAIKELFQQQKEQTQKCLHDTILQCAAGGLDTSLTTLKNQLEQKNRDFDRILEMTLTDGMESEFMEAKMSRLNDEILQIKQMIKRQEHETKMQQAKGDKTRDLLAIIIDRDFQIAEYSDMLVTRMIEQITVLSAEKIRIRFVDGYTKEQRL